MDSYFAVSVRKTYVYHSYSRISHDIYNEIEKEYSQNCDRFLYFLATGLDLKSRNCTTLWWFD